MIAIRSDDYSYYPGVEKAHFMWFNNTLSEVTIKAPGECMSIYVVCMRVCMCVCMCVCLHFVRGRVCFCVCSYSVFCCTCIPVCMSFVYVSVVFCI